jgi:microcompartment protein CcmK/EutM
MAFSLACCADVLSGQRLRHHVDQEQQVIRLVFVTRSYRNLRGERLLIAQLTTPDEGRRCRVAVERAFAAGESPEKTCLRLCRAAAETPLVGVEFDADFENVRLVTEVVVEDGSVTRRQLLAMIDAVVGAAECWQTVVADTSRSPAEAVSRRSGRRRAA